EMPVTAETGQPSLLPIVDFTEKSTITTEVEYPASPEWEGMADGQEAAVALGQVDGGQLPCLAMV
ncbi:MAG: hypothetical protein SNJ62_09105, partial [Chloracidobacterium sp.]